MATNVVIMSFKNYDNYPISKQVSPKNGKNK